MVWPRFTRISTDAVDYDIAQSEPERARAHVYTEEGHRFYSLTLVYSDGSRKTWAYDFMTRAWHERSETRILCATRWRKKRNLIGLEGLEHIFDQQLDWGDNHTDVRDSLPEQIHREATSPVLFANLQRQSNHSLHIDIPSRAGDAADDILLEWSDDGKRTWKGATAQDGTSKAKLLDQGTRFRWNRLGQFREGRNYRLTTAARRRVDILGAYVDPSISPD